MPRGLTGQSTMILTVCTAHVFFGLVYLKGNGPFEVIDLVELEAVFQSFRSGGQNNYTLINGVKMPSLTQNLHFNISQKPSSKLMMNNAHANH